MKKSFLKAIMLILTIIMAAGCAKPAFNGNRTSNDKQFIMDYTILNTTKTHEMKLQEGTVIDVVLEDNSGRLDVLVIDSSGKELYKGDNASSGKFSLKVPKTDTYTFSVKGTNAKGTVSFKAES